MIFLNFKLYPSGTGAKAVEMVRLLEKVSKETGIAIIPVVQAGDVREVSENTSLEVWTQHIDPVVYGAHTGFILPESVKEDGAIGTFLNHSEHKFEDFEKLKSAVNRAKECGLKILIFGDNIDELSNIINLNPDYISYEPSELVGSATVSVATAHPDVIAKAYEIAKSKNIPLIVGAGVHSKEDVKKSLELGAVGIAVASDIMKAEDPEEELRDLVEGFSK